MPSAGKKDLDEKGELTFQGQDFGGDQTGKWTKNRRGMRSEKK